MLNPLLFPVPAQPNSYDCGVYVCRYSFGMFLLRHRLFSYKDGQNDFNTLITQSPEFAFTNDDISRIRVEYKAFLEKLILLYRTKLPESKLPARIAELESAAAGSVVTDGSTSSPLDVKNPAIESIECNNGQLDAEVPSYASLMQASLSPSPSPPLSSTSSQSSFNLPFAVFSSIGAKSIGNDLSSSDSEQVSYTLEEIKAPVASLTAKPALSKKNVNSLHFTNERQQSLQRLDESRRTSTPKASTPARETSQVQTFSPEKVAYFSLRPKRASASKSVSAPASATPARGSGVFAPDPPCQALHSVSRTLLSASSTIGVFDASLDDSSRASTAATNQDRRMPIDNEHTQWPSPGVGEICHNRSEQLVSSPSPRQPDQKKQRQKKAFDEGNHSNVKFPRDADASHGRSPIRSFEDSATVAQVRLLPSPNSYVDLLTAPSRLTRRINLPPPNFLELLNRPITEDIPDIDIEYHASDIFEIKPKPRGGR